MPSLVVVLSVSLALLLALLISVSAYLFARWSGEDRRTSTLWAACTFPVALGTIFLILDQLRAGQNNEAASSIRGLAAYAC
ncbi:hypothetical protein SPW_6467 [Streptomyces sp. W007]|nr:hypothetical protein SPW_6467 [Streptomyces sp. W007]